MDVSIIGAEQSTPRRTSLADTAYEALRQQLLTLDIRPGDPLNDAALAEARDILTERSGHLRAGASATPMPGFAVRVLGRSTPEVAEAIEAVVNLVRARWFGQGAVNLRKY